MKKRTESSILTACLEWLQVMENMGRIAWVDRLNSGELYIKRPSGWQKIRLCRGGTPDAFFIQTNGKVVWIETKIEGGRLEPEQIKFKNMAEGCGQLYWVINDTDSLRNECREIGIK